jgi:hypothetical protein
MAGSMAQRPASADLRSAPLRCRHSISGSDQSFCLRTTAAASDLAAEQRPLVGIQLTDDVSRRDGQCLLGSTLMRTSMFPELFEL